MSSTSVSILVPLTVRSAELPNTLESIERYLQTTGFDFDIRVLDSRDGERYGAMIRRGVKNLHLVALPTSSLQADLLIGAGCVETLETSAVSLGEFGPAPRFALDRNSEHPLRYGRSPRHTAAPTSRNSRNETRQ